MPDDAASARPITAPRRISEAVTALKARFGDQVSTGPSILDQHSRDPAHTVPHRPDAVAFPESTEEVAEIVRICAEHACPIVPFGVGSSLEGHVVPIHGGVSLDMTRMNRVVAVNEADLDAVVQPGVTRVQLNDHLRGTGLMFAVDPGADASMGGMAATRASGTNAVRYGTMRETVMALEVVLADGRIIRTGSRARKSSTGYDLTRLFVGSEGTLGVITELTVRLFGQPEAVGAATCAFETIEGAVDTVIFAVQMGLPIARVELLDAVQIGAANAYSDLGLQEKPHLFLEFHGTDAGVAEQSERFGEIAAENGGSAFSWATATEDRTRLWKARHDSYWAARGLRPGAEGLVTDACVPISALAEAIAETRADLDQSSLISPIVGHVGDGNFHLQLLIEPGNEAEMAEAKALSARLAERTLRLGGTVSGEHGVGVQKMKYLDAEHGLAYSVMGDLKRALDPLNIMNPGKIVDIGD